MAKKIKCQNCKTEMGNEECYIGGKPMCRDCLKNLYPSKDQLIIDLRAEVERLKDMLWKVNDWISDYNHIINEPVWFYDLLELLKVEESKDE